MILVISPAKTLDFESTLPFDKFSIPAFLDDSSQLIDELKKKSLEEIKQLMGLSDKLAELNAQRYKSWQLPFKPENARPGLYAFKGDVYIGLDAHSLSAKSVDYAQEHLRILSGLYGVLKPLDLIQPYRLEMGTRLKTSRGKNLYEFWGSRVVAALNEELAAMDTKVLVNLASNEYFSVLKKEHLKARVVTPQFLDCKNGQYKMISFYAKKARGLMSSWLIRNSLDDPAKIIEFSEANYRFCSHRSEEYTPVFIRDEQK